MRCLCRYICSINSVKEAINAFLAMHCFSYNASWCCVHASNLLHIGCAIGQLEQMALLTLLCLQADRNWLCLQAVELAMSAGC